MKRIIKQFTILLLTGTLFISCQGVFNNQLNSIKESDKETCNIYGLISTDIINRSATTSISDSLSWSVTAKNDTKTIEAIVEGLSYSLRIVKGTWEFTIDGKNAKGVSVITGTKSIEVTEDTMIDVPLSFNEGNGSISLLIKDSTMRASTLICKLKDSEGEIQEITTEFAEGSAILAKSEVVPGAYEAALDFYENETTKIYSCTEIISVYPNLETNKWTGNGAYMADGNFILNFGNLQNFEENQYKTPYVLWNRKGIDDSNVNDNSGFIAEQYVSQYNSGLQIFDGIDVNTEVSDPLYISDSYVWCLDDNNSLFNVEYEDVFDDAGVEITGQKIIIFKTELTDKGYYSKYEKVETPVIEYLTGQDSLLFYNIAWTYDDSSGTKHEYIYLLYSEGYSNLFLLGFDITNWNRTEAITEPVVTKNDWTLNVGGSDYSPSAEDDFGAKIAASGNKVYFVFSFKEGGDQYAKKNKVYVTSFTLEGGALNFDDTEIDKIDITPTHLIPDLYDSPIHAKQGDYKSDYYISDAQIINGELYVLYSLLGSVRGDASNSSDYKIFYHSNGGIVRINLSNNIIETSADGSKVLGWYKETREIPESQVVDQSTGAMDYVPQVVEMSVIPPASAAATHFYGPRKIIARKPDEIIIADDGWEYRDDVNIKIKNHDRLVTVSLKTWAITEAQDIDCMFDGYAARLGTGTESYCFRVY